MYLDFGRVAGHFVLHKEKLERVPCTVKEALASKLMGVFEKKRMGDLLQAIGDYFNEEHKPFSLDPKKATLAEFFKAYKLDPETADFIVHAMALEQNDDCMS